MHTTLTIRPCVAPPACRRADSVSARPRSEPRGAPAAFTLIELLMVLAIIGILSAVAVPRFGGVIANYSLDAAARRIIADLAIARSQAMASSSPQAVTFTGAAYKLAGLASPDHNKNGYLVDLAADPYRITLASADFGGVATVTFDMYGVPSSAGSIALQKGAAKRTVTLDASTGKATSP